MLVMTDKRIEQAREVPWPARGVHVLAPSQLRSWSWRGDTVRYARTSRTLRGEATRTRKTAALIATPRGRSPTASRTPAGA